MSKPDPHKITKQRVHFAWQEMVARSDLSPIFKTVAWALALYRNVESGRCDPSYSRLAEWAGVSERTAKRAIAELERRGLIEVTRTAGRAHDERNRYRLLTPPDLPPDPPRGVQPDTPDVQADTPSGVSADASWGVYVDTESTYHVEREAPRPAQARARVGAIKKNGLEAIENSNGAAWETLRSIWQRPWLDDQNADRAAFTKACHEADPAVIIAAARTWVETVDEPRYLQPLAKWLGNRGWEKEPPKRGRGNRQMSTAEAAYLAGHYPDGTPRDEEAS